MKKLLTFAILIPLLFNSSCKENIDSVADLEVNDLPTFADFHEMISRPTDGKIAIQSNIGINSQNEIRNNTINGYFSIEGENKRINLPKITVGGLPLNISETGNNLTNQRTQKIEDLFGSNVPFKINEEYSNGRTTNVAFELYVPELLIVEKDIEIISEGSLISWNEDEKNKNGIQFKIEYNPLTQYSKEIAEKYPSKFLKGFIFPDTGNITVNSEMLEGFPEGAFVNIIISRGTIDFFNEGEEVYTSGAITSVETRAQVLK